MKITIFTSNHRRHNYYINELLKRGHEVFAVIEATTLLSGIINDHFKSSEIFRTYFDRVLNSEKKLFPNDFYVKNLSNSIVLKCGDLSYLTKADLEDFLNSDCYLTFGCSYIKGWLAEFLIKKHCLNIHMGVSPFYRGANCNFWAAYDMNYEYVGGTIHFLAKGLDSGPIIDVIFPNLNNCDSPFDFTMKSVKSSQDHLINMLENKVDLSLLKAKSQNKKLLIRYTQNKDFNESVAQKFIDRDDNTESIQSCLNRVEIDKSHPLFEIYKPSLV